MAVICLLAARHNNAWEANLACEMPPFFSRDSLGGGGAAGQNRATMPSGK